MIFPAGVATKYSSQLPSGDSLLIVSSCASHDREHVPLITYGSVKAAIFYAALGVIPRVAAGGAEFLTLITARDGAKLLATLVTLITRGYQPLLRLFLPLADPLSPSALRSLNSLPRIFR